MKGLDFAITPRHVLTKEILALVESAMRNLPHEQRRSSQLFKAGQSRKRLDSYERKARALMKQKGNDSFAVVNAD